MFQLEHLVDTGLQCLSESWRGHVVSERLRQLPVELPPIFTQGTFECRLDDDDRIDFQACAPRNERAHAAIREWLLRRTHDDFPSRGHRATAALLREWIEPQTPLGSDIAAIWVEIDIDNATPWPFPFFTLTPPWMRDGPRPPQRTAALVDAGLRLLTGGDLDPRTHTMVHTTLQTLPPQASLFHVAMRPMPGGDVVRLIAGTPWTLVPQFFERMGWPEPVDRVRLFLDRYCVDTTINSIQLDVSADFAPRFGIEFYWPTAPSDPRWHRLFDNLVADGACTAERRDLVCAWPGQTDIPGGGKLMRELLIKVVYEVGKPLRAKAYLPYGSSADIGALDPSAEPHCTEPIGA